MAKTAEKHSGIVMIIDSLSAAARATWMPYHSQSVPLRDIALASPSDRDTQVKEWRDMKLTELNIVSVTGALVAGVVTGTLAWPYPKPWTVTAFWLCGLVFALFSVVLATQQSVVLTRSASGRHALQNLRILMGATTTITTVSSSSAARGKGYVPNKSTLFIWQAATMLLGISIMVLLVGLMVMIYDSARKTAGWGDEAKIAVWFSISMVFGAVTYLISWIGTESRLQGLLLSEEQHGADGGDVEAVDV